ncbi:MAG: hypothetical protein FRX49_12922 [Trebouxia sp. A1-2]|nr:MAG: hypothetical protein FRX49_12922 [Trebouxia sp. A1-2]
MAVGPQSWAADVSASISLSYHTSGLTGKGVKVPDLLGSELDGAANRVARESLPRVPVYVVSPPSCLKTDQNCYAPGGTDECANVKSTWAVYNAAYSDNPSNGVYVCICQGSPVSAQSLASNYSQVPLHLRRWVASVSYVPASQGHAYTSAGHITFFGTFGFDVLVHESTHAQDQGFSGSKAYLQAIGSDPCVPDDYAQTNNVECYAQDMVVFLYKLWRPYDQPLGTNGGYCAKRLQNQLLPHSKARGDPGQHCIRLEATASVIDTL